MRSLTPTFCTPGIWRNHVNPRCRGANVTVQRKEYGLCVEISHGKPSACSAFAAGLCLSFIASDTKISLKGPIPAFERRGRATRRSLGFLRDAALEAAKRWQSRPGLHTEDGLSRCRWGVFQHLRTASSAPCLSTLQRAPCNCSFVLRCYWNIPERMTKPPCQLPRPHIQTPA